MTLGFGEIIRIFLNNLNSPVNITNGPQGINRIDTFKVGEFAFGRTETLMGIRFTGPEKYYYLLLALTLIIVVVCLRLQNSRIGRAWEAIREDEIAAKAMGINTRNIKLLAFAMGASFGGVAGALFASMQGFVSPESFSLMESISILCMVVLGGMGHIGRDPGRHHPGGPARVPARCGRTGAAHAVRRRGAGSGRHPHAVVRPGHGLRDAVPPGRPVAVRRAQARTVQQGPRRCRMSKLLQAQGLGKRFGGLQALSDVSFDIEQGEIYGLIGPNGAGKTTLFNVLTGLYIPEDGSCTFNGQSMSGKKPHEVAYAGLARTFQNIRLFANLSAIESVMIGRHMRTRAGVLGAVLRTRGARAEEAAIEARAQELLEYVGIGHRANDVARSLPTATSAAWRSRARWPPSRSCWRWTNPPPA